MFPIESLKSVHLELSSYCNARCPMCPRWTEDGSLNPHLYQSELRLTDIERLFPLKIAENLNWVSLCGTYGEPTMARDFLEIVSFFKKSNPEVKIHLETNGATRTAEWWHSFGTLLSGTPHTVSFGIDGLADSHHLYRRDTSYEKIMANAAGFIAGGGNARWAFIVFKHNEHQVEDARSLAREMGFNSFVAKKTGRFFSSRKGNYKKKPRVPVANKQGEIEYYLEPPTRPEFLNNAVERAPEITQSHGSFDNYLDNTPITCQSISHKQIYIAANQVILPCSQLHHQIFDRQGSYGNTQGQSAQLIELDEIDGKLHSIEEVLQSASFRRVTATWQLSTIAAGKLKVCSLYCGKEFDKVRAQTTGLYGISK